MGMWDSLLEGGSALLGGDIVGVAGTMAGKGLSSLLGNDAGGSSSTTASNFNPLFKAQFNAINAAAPAYMQSTASNAAGQLGTAARAGFQQREGALNSMRDANISTNRDRQLQDADSMRSNVAQQTYNNMRLMGQGQNRLTNQLNNAGLASGGNMAALAGVNRVGGEQLGQNNLGMLNQSMGQYQSALGGAANLTGQAQSGYMQQKGAEDEANIMNYRNKMQDPSGLMAAMSGNAMNASSQATNNANPINLLAGTQAGLYNAGYQQNDFDQFGNNVRRKQKSGIQTKDTSGKLIE
jgi:hypothetical protein